MKKAHSLALVAAGRIRGSFLARLPGLAEHLGPVKGSSFRLASRVANILRAGYPVRHYGDLKAAGTILIRVPDCQLRATVEELALVPLQWDSASVVLCDSELDAGELSLLAERGAAVASLSTVPGQDDQRLLVEGSRAAVAGLRKTLEPHGVRLIEVECGSKALCLAGLAFAGMFCAPLLAAADRCLQGAGLPAHEASRLLEASFEKSLRGYLKAGRNAIPAARGAQAAIQRQLAALRRHNPELAQVFADADAAVARMRSGSERWLARAAAG